MKNKYEERKYYVTEKAIELYITSQNDIKNIIENINGDNFNLEEKAETIVFHAQQTVEKIMKGFIRDKHSDYKIPKTHDLDELREIYKKLNYNISSLDDDIGRINIYDASFKYEAKHKIKKDEVIEVLKSMANIFEYPLFRENWIEMDNKENFSIFPNSIMKDIVETAMDLKQKIEIFKAMEAIESYKIESEKLDIVLKDKGEEIIRERYTDIHDKEKGLRINKYVYENDKGKRIFILERSKKEDENKYKSDVWIFDNNFNKYSATIFLNQREKEN
jgi:HEPN domain-containing protein